MGEYDAYAEWGYLGRIANTGDHVGAVEGFSNLACLAKARGAIGDCVRPKDHTGAHQGAHFYSWEQRNTEQLTVKVETRRDDNGLALWRVEVTGERDTYAREYLTNASVGGISKGEAIANLVKIALDEDVTF